MPVEQSRDPERFTAFELSGWETNIGGYTSAFGAVARQTVGPMLNTAGVTRGMRVLDVCCGPGMLSAGALERGAEARASSTACREKSSPMVASRG